MLLKLNNIGAARDQLQSAVTEIEQEKINYIEEMYNEDSDDEQTEKKPAKKNALLENAFKELNTILTLLIDVFAKQVCNIFPMLTFQCEPLFQNTFSRILALPTANDELSEVQYETPAIELLSDLFDVVVTPNLRILNIATVPNVFNQILRQLYVVMVKSLEEIVTPMKKQVDPLPGKLIPLIQIILKNASEYFLGDGKGVSSEYANRESKLLMRLIDFHAKPTATIISFYKSKFGTETSDLGSLKRYHLLLILASRKNDDAAAAFVAEHQQLLSQLYVKEKFGMMLNTMESVVLSNRANLVESDYAPGLLALYETFLFFDKQMMKSKKNQNLMFRLSDLESLEKMDKGFKLKMTTSTQEHSFVIQSQQGLENMIRKLITAAKQINPSFEVITENAKVRASTYLKSIGELKQVVANPIVVTDTYFDGSGDDEKRKSVAKVFDTKFNLDVLAAQVRNPLTGVSVKNRSYSFRIYPKCFVGQELVDYFLVRNLVQNRAAAVLLGNELLQKGVFEHVTKQHKFEDKMLFYRFVKKKKVCNG